MADPTPTPKPSDILDPTLERKRKAREKAAKEKAAADKTAKEKAAKEQSQKQKKQNIANKQQEIAQALWDFSNPNIKIDQSGVSPKWSDLFSVLNNYNNFPNQQTPDGDKQFQKYKQAFLALTKQFEKKYNKSVLDVLDYKVGVTASGSYNGYYLPDIAKNNSNFLYQILSDNPQPDHKFIAPKTFVPKKPASGDKAFNGPVTVDPKGTGSNPQTPANRYDWNIAQDSQGNQVYLWGGNSSSAVPVAFLGDYGTGNYIRHNSNYKRGTATGINDINSPQSMDEAYNAVIAKLQSTPGAVENFKRIALAKHIIPASKTHIVMNEPNVIDDNTAHAIGQVINLTTAYNVNLSKFNNPNQKFMSFDHYLNHMNALSETDYSTTRVQTKVNSHDYEIGIDQMFQNILGRGASKDELAHFTKQLQAYANQHPEVTNTTTTPTADGNNISKVQSGGLSSDAVGELMRNQALNTEGAKEYTQGSKYFNWFQQAISGQSQIGR